MPKLTYSDVMNELASLSSIQGLKQMRRFGVNTSRAYGISIANLRKLHKRIKTSHALAKQLWHSPVHEARLLGSMVANPAQTTEADIDWLVTTFDSWDLVDEFCLNLFAKTRFGYRKCFEYCSRKEEFVKRAAFVLMAYYAWYDRSMPDRKLLKFLPIIIRESTDEMNFVRKAVSWALRQIGKRNRNLNAAAIAAAKKIQGMNSNSSQWIAGDALRELTSDSVRKRLK